MNKNPTFKETEKQIADFVEGSEAIFKQLIQNSFDMIVLLNSDGIQYYVSESCEKILGYRSEELINIPIIEQFIHPEDQGKARAGLQDILEKSTNGGAQYRHRHKNGNWVYLEAFGTNQISNPFIRSVILNVRDITKRKEAEKALKESEIRLSELNATKDRFFSILGHDLKSPFNSILGFSNLLADQINKKDYQELERYARIIQESSQRAMDLITNLLDWSLSQSGKIEFTPEYIELVAIINEVAELLSDSAQQKFITISKKIPHNITVLADKAMVHTVLRNLICNGIKFTEPGGEIRISTEQKDNQLVVSVADNGIGIKEKDIDKLFRIESNYSRLGTNKEKGTGLGLLLCKEFIETHKGKIWAESRAGKGSIFNFTLPVG